MKPDYVYADLARDDIAARIPADARLILDVGAGRGGFCNNMRQRLPNAEVWGIEPNLEAATEAESRADRIVRGLFPDDMPADAPLFDVITFGDVIEHVADPWALLERTKEHLAPRGVIVASIPNMRHWTVLNSLIRYGDFTYRSSGIMDKTHLRFFTQRTMLDLFDHCGYEVRSCEPNNLSAFWKVRLIQIFAPRFGQDIRALQYVIVAAPRDCQVRAS